MKTKAHSLAHTKWLCKYHIVFTPKYRRKIIFAQLRESIKEILQCLCKYKGVEILEGHLMPDHVHMLVSIPPKISVANFMGYLKGKSSLMIFDTAFSLPGIGLELNMIVSPGMIEIFLWISAAIRDRAAIDSPWLPVVMIVVFSLG